MKYVLRLCQAGDNGGLILAESAHDSFDAAMDAIPCEAFPRAERYGARVRADIKNTLDSVGAWTITGIGDKSYIIHTRKENAQ